MPSWDWPLFVQPIPSFHKNHCQINPISNQLNNACSSLIGRGRRSAACDYTMDVLGLDTVTVRLTTSEAIVITLFFLLIWFAGYLTGAEVTHLGEDWDCLRLYFPTSI